MAELRIDTYRFGLRVAASETGIRRHVRVLAPALGRNDRKRDIEPAESTMAVVLRGLRCARTPWPGLAPCWKSRPSRRSYLAA